MASDIQIISDAFINLGKKPVNSPLTDNPEEAAAKDIYDHLLPNVLTWHPWRFAMKNLSLTQVNEDSPFDRWQNVFELPGDLLLAYRTEPICDFEIFQDRLYTDQDVIKLEYTFEASEANFPPYFTDLMVLVLTARIAMTVTQQPTLAAFWQKEADRALAVARNLDSAIMPNPSIARDQIYEAHLGWGSTALNRFR
jgi:hypothetical protein